ncbi:MAG: YheC/YheD family protein [Eubacteriales bacterium]|nr:YheC/YheD family protein [Eubacteriales bacterium]MDD4768207.1 YheC/YheD family protein [Eubacteriales bacterium]
MGDNILVGVLISAKRLKCLREDILDRTLKLILEANQSVGTRLFFFALENVDIKTKMIQGWTILEDAWVRCFFPYPQAIYLRSTYSRGNRQLLSAFFRQLERQQTVFINYPLRMDKWEMYKCLASRPGLEQFVPPTWPIRSPEEIKKLLESNLVLYLKACLSGRGEKVMRVEDLKTGEYYFSRYADGLKTGKMHWGGLLQEIQAFFNQSKIIAQKEIDLIKVAGCNVDFRAELYRRDGNLPKIIGIPVRIGQLGSPITTHSVSMSLENFCACYSLVDYPSFMKKAEDFLTQTYTALEGCFGESGELGIDFGLDTEGQLWFIEGNSHSAKVSLYNSYADDILIQSYQGLLEYAQYRVSHILLSKKLIE